MNKNLFLYKQFLGTICRKISIHVFVSYFHDRRVAAILVLSVGTEAVVMRLQMVFRLCACEHKLVLLTVNVYV